MSGLESIIAFNTLSAVAIKGAALLGIGAPVHWLLRNRSAGLRHGVWVAIVSALIALPILEVVTPKSLFVLEAQPAHRTLIPFAVPGKATATTSNPPHRGSHSDIARRTIDVPDTVILRPSYNQPTTRLSILWLDLIVFGWLLGLFGILARILTAQWRARMLRRGAVRLRTASVRGRPVPIVVSSRVEAPVTVGIVWPTVVVPTSANTWSDETLETSINHELAHVARGDNGTDLLAALACALYWFNPMAWWARKQMRRLREFAADDRVLRRTAATDYAAVLARVARELQPRTPSISSLGRKSELRLRVERLLDDTINRQRPRFARSLMGVGVLVLATVSMTTWGVDASDLPSLILTERARSYPRPPALGPARPGRAAPDYRRAEALALAIERHAHGDHLSNWFDKWSEAPPHWRQLAGSNEAMKIAKLITEGARRIDGRSPRRGGDTGLDFEFFETMSVLQIVVAVALEQHHSGHSEIAARTLLSLKQYADDVARGSTLSDAAASSGLSKPIHVALETVVNDVASEHRGRLLTAWKTLLDNEPGWGSILRQEAVWSGQGYPGVLPVRHLTRAAAMLDGTRYLADIDFRLLAKLYAVDDEEFWPRYLSVFADRRNPFRMGYIRAAAELYRDLYGALPSTTSQLEAALGELPRNLKTGESFVYRIEDGNPVISE